MSAIDDICEICGSVCAEIDPRWVYHRTANNGESLYVCGHCVSSDIDKAKEEGGPIELKIKSGGLTFTKQVQ